VGCAKISPRPIGHHPPNRRSGQHTNRHSTSCVWGLQQFPKVLQNGESVPIMRAAFQDFRIPLPAASRVQPPPRGKNPLCRPLWHDFQNGKWGSWVEGWHSASRRQEGPTPNFRHGRGVAIMRFYSGLPRSE
jgi:hypothetical protein